MGVLLRPILAPRRVLAGVLLLVLTQVFGCADRSTDPAAPVKGSPAAAPETPIEPPGILAVPGQLVIRVAPGRTIDEVNAEFGTTVLEALPDQSTYLVAASPSPPLSTLAADLVGSMICDTAEPNYLLTSPETEQASLAIYEGSFDHGDYVDQEALVRIRADRAHAHATGVGVIVAVIDTGVDLDHPDLLDNLAAAPPGFDFIDEDLEPEDLPNGIDDNGNNLVDEAAGHGSHVAGIVAATAPDAGLLPLRVLDSDGTGTAYNVVRAIYHAIDSGADVINLSLGLEVNVLAMETAIRVAHEADILVVASAGNRGISDEDHFPAGYAEVMAVTATDAADRKAPFASFGEHISMSAPGVGIMSTYWNGGYAVWSGTSMSTPMISGAGALCMSLVPVSPDEAKHLIEDGSVELDGEQTPYEGLMGEGRVDLFGLVNEALHE